MYRDCPAQESGTAFLAEIFADPSPVTQRMPSAHPMALADVSPADLPGVGHFRPPILSQSCPRGAEFCTTEKSAQKKDVWKLGGQNGLHCALTHTHITRATFAGLAISVVWSSGLSH